jgi:hypothetical protein
VAETVWRAANDVTGQYRFPAGHDATIPNSKRHALLIRGRAHGRDARIPKIVARSITQKWNPPIYRPQQIRSFE